MSLSLCPVLLLVFLMIGGSVLLTEANDTEIPCGEDSDCQSTGKVMAVVNEIHYKRDEHPAFPCVDERLDKQAEDLKELKKNLDRNFASTSEQLRRLSADIVRHDERLKTHIESPGGVDNLLESIYGAELGPRDCTDIRAMGFNVSGIYQVYPGSDTRRIETDVCCDFNLSTESWLVFHRRKDGSQNFSRTFKEYEHGFGALDGEFWIGNERLSLITTNKKYKLRIDLMDFLGEKRYAE